MLIDYGNPIWYRPVVGGRRLFYDEINRAQHDLETQYQIRKNKELINERTK